MLLDPFTPELNRPYFARVRPLHHETLENFSARLLEANHEDESHRRYLLSAAAKAQPTLSDSERWARVITVKAGLAPHHFDRAQHVGLHHADGRQCAYCTMGVEERWMCTLCSHGLDVPQYAHFDGNVCLKHNRWVGPGTRTRDQRPATPTHQRAEADFRRLVRRRSLDPVLYMLLRDALRSSLSEYDGAGDDHQATDYAHYPALIAVADAVTSPAFLRRLFDTARSFADAYSLLAERVETVIDDPRRVVTRAIWLHMRSTFLSVRDHFSSERPFAPAWAHDFNLPSSVVAELRPGLNPERFRDYLRASGDFDLTLSNWRAVQLHHTNPPKYPGTNRRAEDDLESICVQGHRITRQIDFAQEFNGSREDSCRVCTGRELLVGYNDIVTRYARLGAEFHSEDNDGIKPREVLAGSSTTFKWRCTKSNHLFEATPARRVHSDSGCPVCEEEDLAIGDNDLRTRYPRLAFEWHHTLNSRTPDEVSADSPDQAWWICNRGHVWEALISSRISGSGCPTCIAREARSHSKTLAKVRPELALEWDTERNGNIEPEDVAVHSDVKRFWKCPSGHSYAETPRKRSHGASCTFCSRPRASLEEMDVATLYPLIANDWDCAKNLGASPRDILPSKKLFDWLCRQGHETRQSVPHRVESNGCIRCPKELRSGFVGKY